ncbi:MAG: 4Fe-4S dicluster domain-containing protein [Deltaproteobacteria bacterium]|nr:4Fe-4S dicluster domain-containing protein [Deltaproteobacteria bacterium]
MERRDFLKLCLSSAGGLFLSGFARSSRAFSGEASEKEFMGILVDTTKCIGCRSCEVACSSSHGLPSPNIEQEVWNVNDTTTERLTVINRFSTAQGNIFVKKQCMHCNIPACVAACLVKAMKKREEGHVTWEENCMGCRYCMFSCPFGIPRFEYASPTPRLQKCDLCYERYLRGEPPACVETCPQEALIFGTRRELLLEAKKRIALYPKRYVPHVYGEKEVGGTGYMYLASVPFDQIGFRTDLESKPLPEYTRPFLYSEPLVLIFWCLFFLGLNRITKKEEKR